MLDDKRCITALLKIMNEHTLQGREASAFLQLAKWVSELDNRLAKCKETSESSPVVEKKDKKK